MTIEELQAELESLREEMKSKDTSIKGLEQKNSELIDREKAERSRADKAEKAKLSDLEQAQLDRQQAQADRDLAQRQLREYRRDADIARASADANVDAKHVPLLSKFLRSDDYNDDGFALIEGKTVADYAKGFFAKDGLAYVRAPANGGGVSTGYDGSKAPALTKRPSTPAEWAILNGLETAERNALCDSIGAADLKL